MQVLKNNANLSIFLGANVHVLIHLVEDIFDFSLYNGGEPLQV